MRNTIYQPSPALQPYIDHYQVWQFNHSEHGNFSMRDYPRTAMDMVFCFQGHLNIALDDQSPFQIAQACFISHFDQPYQIILNQDLLILHIQFKPNGIYPLTKIPLQELLNGKIQISELLNKNVSEVHELMAEQDADEGKIRVFEKYMCDIYANSQFHHRLDYGLAIIQEKRGVLAVKELGQALNTNYKSLDRWFQKYVGLSPKRFMRITRFKNILCDLEQVTDPDWMQLVADYGYHDQAHFIKDFREFSGDSPDSFFFKV